MGQNLIPLIWVKQKGACVFWPISAGVTPTPRVTAGARKRQC